MNRKHTSGLFRAAAILCALGLSASALAQEDDWYPSPYGAEDEIGALNLLGPDDVRRGAGLVRQGKVFSRLHFVSSLFVFAHVSPTESEIFLFMEQEL